MLALPEGVFQSIVRHFSASEIAKGPSQACSTLKRLQLPHIELNPVLPDEEVSPRPTQIYLQYN